MKRSAQRRYLSFVFVPSFGAALIAVAVTAVYLLFFHAPIADGEWEHANGFARILIPDTYVYLGLLDEDFSSLGFALAGIKNAIGPAMMWWAVDQNWYVMALANVAMLLATMRYMAKICMRYGMRWREAARLCVIIGLLPTTWYHSVGALKEMPTLLGLTAFFYYHLSGRHIRCVVTGLLLVIFRYQLAVILPAFALIGYFSRKPLRATVLALVLVAMAYPALASLDIFSQETTSLFRDEAESDGMGALVETVRDHVPVASALAVFVRVLQTIFEPVLTFLGSWSVNEDGEMSVLACAYLISTLILLPSIWRTGARIAFMLRAKRLIVQELQMLYALIIIFAVPVGGFSFIHNRYLFPLTALVLIAGTPTSRAPPKP